MGNSQIDEKDQTFGEQILARAIQKQWGVKQKDFVGSSLVATLTTY